MADDTKPHAEPGPEAAGGHVPDVSVVGVGASAAKLRALTEFFGSVSADSGLAYVVVVHLSPTYESHLADLLQSHTTMPVRQVTRTVPLRPNEVYVIPPGRNLSTIDTHLRLSNLEREARERAPIDHFFRTLSETYAEKAIGLILSGTGSDGTIGFRMIREQGGLTIAQDPSEAEYDGMPQSAITSGGADLVLPIHAMPEHILRYARTNPAVPVPEEGDLIEESNKKLLLNIVTQVRARTGHDFSRYKRSTLVRRVRRRMQIRQIETLEEYHEFLRQNCDEVNKLFDDLVITVTNFFRDADVFAHVEQEIVPRLFESKGPEDRVRVWSVGCSTGEEAYSLAILLLEYASRMDDPPEVQVFASDIHESSLRKAREGVYPETIEADVTPDRLRRYFVWENGGYSIRKDVRQVVIFAPHDLLKDPPFSRIGLITCRNVLIYLQRDVQQEVIGLFHYVLDDHGYLVVGTSETVDRSDLFLTENKQHCTYRRRPVPTVEPRLPMFPVIPTRLTDAERPSRRSEPPATYGAIHQKVVGQYAPPSILVNQDYEIVHHSAHAGRYLSQPGGEPTNKLFKLVCEPLRIELRTAFYSARERGESYRSEPIPIDVEGRRTHVTVRVRPPLDDELRNFSLIIFDETAEAASPEEGSGATPDATVSQLESELDMTRQRLQAIIEEYETSQEEMKASNEELQSMNEELTTVNQDNRHKVEELSQLSGDLQNLLAATDIATLFLDRELRILRFTPCVGELFNVRASDRGRPLSDLTHRLGYGELHVDAEKVLDSLMPVTREVMSEDGAWFLTRVLPYRSTDDRIDGVVITFVDITDRKCAEQALAKSEANFRSFFDSVGMGAAQVSPQKRFIRVNNRFCEMTGFAREELLRRGLLDIDHPDYREKDREELEAFFNDPEGATYQVEKRYARKDGATIWVHVAATRVRIEDSDDVYAAVVFEDITERRRAQDELRELNRTLEERVEERTRQVRDLAYSLTMAEQEERRRIARLLHDDLQQVLCGVQIKISQMRDSAEQGNIEDVHRHSEDGNQWLTTAINTTRQLTVDLSPPLLKEEGLADALEWLAGQMKRMYDLNVQINADQSFPIENEDMRVLIFQIIRELLFNVVKHGDTDQAEIELTETEDNLVCVVCDEGKGFEVRKRGEEADPLLSWGLYHARERLGLFGGKMLIESEPGEGTRITILVPKETEG